MTALRDSVQEGRSRSVSHYELLVVNFLKNHFVYSGIFSLPSYVFKFALETTIPPVCEPIGEGVLLDAIEDKCIEGDVDINDVIF